MRLRAWPGPGAGPEPHPLPYPPPPATHPHPPTPTRLAGVHAGDGRDIELRHQRSPDVIFDCVRAVDGAYGAPCACVRALPPMHASTQWQADMGMLLGGKPAAGACLCLPRRPASCLQGCAWKAAAAGERARHASAFSFCPHLRCPCCCLLPPPPPTHTHTRRATHLKVCQLVVL